MQCVMILMWVNQKEFKRIQGCMKEYMGAVWRKFSLEKGSKVQKAQSSKTKINMKCKQKKPFYCNLINVPRRQVARKCKQLSHCSTIECNRICDLKGNGRGKSGYLVLSYLRLEGISDFGGNRPVNHQNSLISRQGNNNGINDHRWLYYDMSSLR